MRFTHGTRGGTVANAIGCLVIAFALALAWAHMPRQLVFAASQSVSSTATNSAGQKSIEDGVWHHFGENASPPPAEPRQPGVWRHFGPGTNIASPPSGYPSRPNLELSRTGQLEQLMYELVNRDRADPANTLETNGRALPLRWNDRLAQVARAHSLDMLRQGYFGHEDPQGRSVANRVEAAGMEWRAVGENIAIYNDVARAEAAFMNEPRFRKNHRGNILSPDFTEVGIGIVQAPNGSLYITQDFYTALSNSSSR